MSTHWTFDALQIVEPLASFLIDISAKGTVILLLALLLTWVLRRSSAAMRHAVWSLAMLSLVLLPVAWCALPSLAIPILPRVEPPVPSVAIVTAEDRIETPPETLRPQNVPPEPIEFALAVSADSVASSVPQREESHDFRPEPAIAPLTQPVDSVSETPVLATQKPNENIGRLSSALISFVWGFGVSLFAAVLALCVLKAGRLRRRSELVTTGVWYGLLAELSQRLRIRRPVELREHSEPIVPLTWGVIRSVVLLPESARDWAEPMKRTVLLHELAHVRRGDVACQLLGRIACTLFWFHPLAWYGLRRLRQEGEQACDDAVVFSGEKASDYADQLLQVAQFCCEPRGLSLGVSMAEGSNLEVRVKSLFDTNRSHEPLPKRTSLILLLLCAITLATVSAIRPVEATIVAAEASSDSAQAPLPAAEDTGASRTNAVSSAANAGEPEVPVTEKMRPVTSRELTGIWQGVTNDFGVVVQFIGRESRQHGKGPVHSGRWTVHIPRGSIGSALEFKDNEELGVVDLEVGRLNTKTKKRFRVLIGRVERGLSGQVYLTVFETIDRTRYPSIIRLPLTHVSSEQTIRPLDIYHLFVAEELLEKGTIKDLPTSISKTLKIDKSRIGTASRPPQLSVPEEWKSQALDRIVKLCPEFGPEHGGLTLGIARTTGQTVFRMGNRIPLELVVMNVGARERTFQFRSTPRVSYAPEVVDSNGHVVRGISGTTVFQPPYSVDLKPGEACSIPVGGLGIGDQGTSNFEAPTAGRYEMSYRIGTLKSATMRFKVGTDKEGSFRLDVLDDRWGLRHGSAERVSILKPVFGKARRGIQMGIAFAGTRKTYSTGEKIPIDLFFRNAGDRNVKFQFTADFYWSPPTVVNEQGERVHIPPLPVWMVEGPRTVNLKPGQAFAMKTLGLGLSKGNGAQCLVAPPAGKYRIGLSRTIYDYVDPRGELPDQVHEWQEHLITGSLEIEVGDEQDGTQTAKLLPGKTESLNALKEDVTRIMARSDGLPELPVGAPPSGPVTEDPTPSEPKPASSPEPSLSKQATKIPLKDVIWWKTTDGLQAGFLLDSPAIPNQRIPYNSVARYRILVRNTTDKDIRFVARLLPHEGVDAPFLIPSDNITESLAAPKLPEKFRTEGVPRRFKRHDPAYFVTLAPAEAVFIPGQSGLDELSLYVGDAEEKTHPTASKIQPGLNWIVQPLQLQLIPAGGFPNGTSLMGRFKITRINQDGLAKAESASRMVAVPGGKTLYPRIQLDVGTLTAAAVRNAKSAAWGKIDKGLQCGIRMINPKWAYVVGDTLEAEFFWRNTSEATIWSPLPRQFDLYPIVTNDEGQELSVDFGARMLLPAISLAFEAGKVRSLGVSKITLVEKGTPSPRSNMEPAHLIVEPGTYKLSGSGGVSAPDGGRPRSGSIEFVVIGREPVQRPNLKQRQKAAKVRIEELGGEVTPYDKTTVAVTLWKTKATDKDLEMLKCYDLVALGLTGTKITDAGLVHIKDMKRLGDLELTDTKVTDAGLVHLTKLGNLGILSLYGTKVTDVGLQHLKPLKSLYLLGLSHTAVTDKGLVHLSELPSIRTLILDHLKITDRGIVHLQNLKTLNDIRLGGTEITDKGLQHLRKMSLLRTVELSQTRITGSGLRHLPASTKTLWLPLTQVDDDGLKHIAHLTKLETLVLNNSKITDEGLKLLEKHSSLRNLQLGQTNVTDAGVATLKAALPNCKVSH